jgi:formate/nitrite transporter FocA (FNT family)
MRSNFKTILGAILSGLLISVGCTVNLLNAAPIGQIFFSVALSAILILNVGLYTGRIGYVKTKTDIKNICIILVGNLIGTWLGSVLLTKSIGNELVEKSANIVNSRMNSGHFNVFILAIFCGILMYAAVEGYKITKNLIIVILCIYTFIACGFSHCIADSFYYMCATDELPVFMFLVSLAGNSIGSLFCDFVVNRLGKK